MDPNGVIIIAEFEGYSIQEARLTYAARQKLPKSAFCGPDRSYPAHDAAHVRNGFARLATFGKRLPRNVAKRIYGCLKSRAKRFGVEHDPTRFAWITGKTKKKKVQECKMDFEDVIGLLDEDFGCSSC